MAYPQSVPLTQVYKARLVSTKRHRDSIFEFEVENLSSGKKFFARLRKDGLFVQKNLQDLSLRTEYAISAKLRGIVWLAEQTDENGAVMNACAMELFGEDFAKKQARRAFNLLMKSLLKRQKAFESGKLYELKIRRKSTGKVIKM